MKPSSERRNRGYGGTVQSPRILVIEDEARIASFLSKGLRAQGYRVDHVMNGADALAAVDLDSPDLVILDLGLPDIDGLDVVRRMRAAGNDVPVIILTARSEQSQRAAGFESGANDYVTKPFVFNELNARVRACLSARAD